jgi:hypothetical protein
MLGCDQKIENPDSAALNPRTIDPAHEESRVSSRPNTRRREKHVHTHAWFVHTHYTPRTALSLSSCVLHRFHKPYNISQCESVRERPVGREIWRTHTRIVIYCS